MVQMSLGATQTAPVNIQVQPASGSLFDKAVLLNLSISKLGTRRKVKSSAVEVDADLSMVHVSKDILESSKLGAIAKFDSVTRAAINLRCLPSMFRSGIFLLPMALVEDTDSYLTDRADQRAALVAAFVDEYQLARQDASSRLGVLYNPADYPPVEKVSATFGMSWQYIESGVPGRLRDISPIMFEREREKAESCWKTAIDEARALLRDQLAGLVDHMVDRLTPSGDGKPKVFRDTLISNLASFLELFEPRNIAGDAELATVVQQCRILLNGSTSPAALRTDEALRDRVASGMSAIKATLDTMVASKPSRSIDLSATDDWADI